MADVKPTLFVTNWSSRGLHGSGRKFTIMAAPREREHGDGKVLALVPDLRDLRRVKAGELSLLDYRVAFLRKTAHLAHAPGSLYAMPRDGSRPILVEDGDTLCCACSREDAADGRCHRTWAADLLFAAGWGVLLDGQAVR